MINGQNCDMCISCMGWDKVNGGCMIHNTIPGGCKDFRSADNKICSIPKPPNEREFKGGIALL